MLCDRTLNLIDIIQCKICRLCTVMNRNNMPSYYAVN